jgi:hypothetical protein
MLIIDNVLISSNLFHTYFMCDISNCKGICCVEGDAGAPLEEEEIALLEDAIDVIKPYMTKEGVHTILQQGVFDYDMEGSLVTPLVGDRECAFVYFEDTIAKCAIEKAYQNRKTDFQKPLSCHLYPIRITKHSHYESLDYHQWYVCEAACEKGEALNIKVFDFLQEPLLRKYGKQWMEKVRAIRQE